MQPDRVKRNMELKLARMRINMPQKELSMLTWISVADISLFERGFSFPTKRQAVKIAKVLGVDDKNIFPEITERKERMKAK